MADPTASEVEVSTSPSDSPNAMGGSTSTSRPPKSRIRRWWLYEVVAVILVVMLILLAYEVTGGFGGNSSSGPKTLIAEHTLDSIPAGQFDAVSFIISSNSNVSGSFFNTYSITLYRMTPTQFESFIKTTTLAAGYEWTSNPIPDDTVTNLALAIPPGSWDLIFNNPSPVNATAVAFYSSLTLSSS
jgi:hypothetical protein